MRAIDLYSGIGGWTVGLKAAGIDVISSYELCNAAVRTSEWNLGKPICQTDIIRLKPEELPDDIDIVVGSPPCTEFSFANRGGNGDVSEGLLHVRAFLKIVEAVNPDFWVLENVPRLKQILETELKRGGFLYRYRHLFRKAGIRVIDVSDYGLPQRRLRCIAGNIPFDLLSAYAERCPRRSLGDAIGQLEKARVRDINFGIRLPSRQITEHEKESPLDWEEIRINRDAKQHHPIYNSMSFPDRPDRPVRTITATCTRISRESVVIKDDTAGQYRRLTVRERATLQGFPVTYQFYGGSHGEKLRLIGNALPPPLSYYIGLSMRGVSLGRMVPLYKRKHDLPKPQRPICITKTDSPGRKYPSSRRFRFSVPSLRFKSGTRFDLTNDKRLPDVSWRMEFVFGPSTDFRHIRLGKSLYGRLKKDMELREFFQATRSALGDLDTYLRSLDLNEMQERWVRKTNGPMHPFTVIRKLGGFSRRIANMITDQDASYAEKLILEIAKGNRKKKDAVSERKLKRFSSVILAGLIVGSLFNQRFANKTSTPVKFPSEKNIPRPRRQVSRREKSASPDKRLNIPRIRRAA